MPFVRAAHNLVLSDHINVLIEDITTCIPYVASMETVVKDLKEDQEALGKVTLKVLNMPMGALPPFVVPQTSVRTLKQLITLHFKKPCRQTMGARLPSHILKKLLKSFDQLSLKLDTLSSLHSYSTTGRCERDKVSNIGDEGEMTHGK